MWWEFWIKKNWLWHKVYDYTEEDLSGVHAAAALGYDADMVFKTIVTKGDKTGPVVFCLPAEKEIDLKAAARVSGNKSVEMIHVKELPGLTGYIRGGCSPIGMKKEFPTYIDESCYNHERISISAGQRGRQVLIAPKDLVDWFMRRQPIWHRNKIRKLYENLFWR